MTVLSNDFLVISTLGAEFNENHVHMQKILSQVDILYAWAKIHEGILERYQQKKYFGFSNFIQNEQYSNTLNLLLAIQVPVLNQPVNSILSFTGFPKLDNILNLLKCKTLEILNYIYRYLFENIPQAAKKTSPFLPKSLTVCEILIQSLVVIS
jgi:hypothetical protein